MFIVVIELWKEENKRAGSPAVIVQNENTRTITYKYHMCDDSIFSILFEIQNSQLHNKFIFSSFRDAMSTSTAIRFFPICLCACNSWQFSCFVALILFIIFFLYLFTEKKGFWSIVMDSNKCLPFVSHLLLTHSILIVYSNLFFSLSLSFLLFACIKCLKRTISIIVIFSRRKKNMKRNNCLFKSKWKHIRFVINFVYILDVYIYNGKEKNNNNVCG